MLVWQRLLDAIDRHGNAGMATLVDTRGLGAARGRSAVMVMPDGSFTGTIGGGTLEWRAIAELGAARAGSASAHRHDCAASRSGPSSASAAAGASTWRSRCSTATGGTRWPRWQQPEAAGPFQTRAGIERPSGPLPCSTRSATATCRSAARADWTGGMHRGGLRRESRSAVSCSAPATSAGRWCWRWRRCRCRMTWIDPRPDAFPAHVPGAIARLRPAV